MDKSYIELFEFIEGIIQKQESQKLRGLNDYNIVNVVQKASCEVGMHSKVIYSLINPNGLHYQNDLFLNLFIEYVLGFNLKDFGEIQNINVKEVTDQNRRIDFTIKSENYFIGIEMKINATDLNNQISHYKEYLEKQANHQKVLLYYLTKDGKDASKKSKNNVDIERVSFQNHILTWLNACQSEVKNITNLNVALEDYKNIVKKITGKYKGNVVSIEEELVESKVHLKTVLSLDEKMKKIKGNILFKFFQDVELVLGKDNQSISNKIQNPTRVLSKIKCIQVFTRGRKKHTYFGYFYDYKFKNNLYLHIQYAQGGLYVGVVKLDYECNFLEINENDISFEGGFLHYENKNYGKKFGDIKRLNNDNILDFKNSNLKDEILTLIDNIPKIGD